MEQAGWGPGPCPSSGRTQPPSLCLPWGQCYQQALPSPSGTTGSWLLLQLFAEGTASWYSSPQENIMKRRSEPLCVYFSVAVSPLSHRDYLCSHPHRFLLHFSLAFSMYSVDFIPGLNNSSLLYELPVGTGTHSQTSAAQKSFVMSAAQKISFT